jgi:hypothetical protein
MVSVACRIIIVPNLVLSPGAIGITSFQLSGTLRSQSYSKWFFRPLAKWWSEWRTAEGGAVYVFVETNYFVIAVRVHVAGHVFIDDGLEIVSEAA